jgi:hypothetical protein
VTKRPQLKRRDFLRLSAFTTAGATLVACSGSESVQWDMGVAPNTNRIIFNRYPQPSFEPQAVYVYSDEPVVQLDQGQEFPRNDHQLAGLRAAGLALPAADPVFGASLDWAYREYIVRRLSAGGNDEATPLGDAPAQAVDYQTRRRQLQTIQIAAQPAAPGDAQICLFNVLVALEWIPEPAYLSQLEWAFRRGSDFLYDVTDGSMAFGQVVFGGPELMDSADIQIMASNRLNPRSWVSGLHIPRKYMPIRIGRGVWHRSDQVTIPWDEPEAYRTLIHEWGHYALEQRDTYLEQRQLVPTEETGLGAVQLLVRAQPDETALYTIVIPHTGQTSESIMATTEGKSELVAHTAYSSTKRKSEEWSIILKRYPWLNPSAQSLEGPGRRRCRCRASSDWGRWQGALRRRAPIWFCATSRPASSSIAVGRTSYLA